MMLLLVEGAGSILKCAGLHSDSAKSCKTDHTALLSPNGWYSKAYCRSNPSLSRQKYIYYSSKSPDLWPLLHVIDYVISIWLHSVLIHTATCLLQKCFLTVLGEKKHPDFHFCVCVKLLNEPCSLMSFSLQLF